MCQSLVEGYQDIYATYHEDGLQILTVLIQDLDGHPPDPADAGLWVDQYGIAWPVLADRKETWAQQYLSQVDDPLTVWLIGREGEILYREVGETYTSAGRTKKAVGAALAAQ